MKKIVVNKKYENKKLINFILDSFPDLSLNTLNKALRQKDIRINGIRIKDNVTLSENDEVLVYIADEFLFKKININIVYEDENILAINKPCGIEVVTENNQNERTLTSILQEKYEFIQPCHRLDRNTSRASFICKK